MVLKSVSIFDLIVELISFSSFGSFPFVVLVDDCIRYDEIEQDQCDYVC